MLLDRLFVYGLPAFGFVMSIVVTLGVLVLPALEARDLRTWVATPCEITESKLVDSGSGKHRTQLLEVRYTYSVGGKEFTGNRVRIRPRWFGGSLGAFGSNDSALTEEYRAKSKVTCYVDPTDPSKAILDRTFRLGPLHAVFPVLVVIAGFYLGRNIWKHRRIKLEA